MDNKKTILVTEGYIVEWKIDQPIDRFGRPGQWGSVIKIQTKGAEEPLVIGCTITKEIEEAARNGKPVRITVELADDKANP